MSWVTIGLQDVQDRMTPAELGAFQQGNTNPAGYTGALQTVVTYVTELVRGKVAVCRENRYQMGPAGTIPSEVYLPALDLCRYQIAASVPDMKDLVTTLRKDVYDVAMKVLDSAAQCELVIMGYGATNYDANPAQVGGKPRIDNPWCGPTPGYPSPYVPNFDGDGY